MVSLFYQKNIIEKPKLTLLLLFVFLVGFGFFSKDFKLDASSDTLLLENDPDLKYLREVTDRYGSKEFLILTYTPDEPMISESSLNNLLSLKYKIQSLEWVYNVITLLDVPLLNNSDKPLNERIQNFETLKNENVDKERDFKEILNSPVFKNFVISEDGNTTGIIVNIKTDEKIKLIKNKKELEKHKNFRKKQNHQNILEIREVIKSYDEIGNIFLGGIPMIADDMISFIKNDIVVFGIGVLLFIIATRHTIEPTISLLLLPENIL